MSLFHYTDVQTVHSILLNKKLWLTDIRFLNDSEELEDGISRLSEALLSPSRGISVNPTFYRNSIDYLRSAFSDTVSFGIDEEPIFVFSLSRVEDLLSQWRAYGSYAIEFDEKALSVCVPALRACIYDINRKNAEATISVATALTNISREMGGHDGDARLVGLDSVVNLIELAATFKNQGFSEEQEVRIVTQASETEKSIKYRPKGNRLIPYLEVPITMDCIKSIRVGPMNEQDLALLSMSGFVRQIERDWQSESTIEYELHVEKSSIPFRGTWQ
jgi:hypothetical protein